MKKIGLILIAIILFSGMSSYAQLKWVDRKVTQKMFGADSINLQFDKDYYLIEDDCARIIRYAHFDTQRRVFFGHFKDVDKSNVENVVAEGNYNGEGKLEGNFTLHHLNGNVQAIGNFKSGSFAGEWQVFYADGKPQLTFTNVNDTLYIKNAWNSKGKQTVINGKGKYKVEEESIVWNGNVIKGRPDGTWRSTVKGSSGSVISTEIFDKGDFKEGSGPLGSYYNYTRLSLINKFLVPVIHADELEVAGRGCFQAPIDETFELAHYRDGSESFLEQLTEKMPILILSQAKALNGKKIVLLARINEKGNVTKVELEKGSPKVNSLSLRERCFI